jgi:hypothetical protein
MIKERPILFNGAMVRAILEGRKTQTRRVIKAPKNFKWSPGLGMIASKGSQIKCPYEVCDRLWVRETFYCDHFLAGDYDATRKHARADWTNEECEADWRGNPIAGPFMYFRADVPSGRFYDAGYWDDTGSHWKPSIHMPRWASRITLEITSVRAERLQDISNSDIIDEGIHSGSPVKRQLEGDEPANLKEQFQCLWESTGGDWNKNPWVWVIEFRRIV